MSANMHLINFTSCVLIFLFTLDVCLCDSCNCSRSKNDLYLQCNPAREDQIQDCFEKNNDSIFVSVTQSGLRRIPPSIRTLTRVQHLDLSHNNITEIDNYTLNCLGGTLQILVMNYNNVSVLRNGSLDNLTSLQEIYLEHNGLTEIETNVINLKLKTLSIIQFSFNQLKLYDIGLVWVPMLFRGIRVLVNVSRNVISNFTNHKGIRVSDFSLNNSFRIDLIGNNLTTIDVNYLLRLVKVEHIWQLYNLGNGSINILHNPLVCDCLLFPFSLYINIYRMIDDLNPIFIMDCYNPPALKYQLIYRVPIQDFNCSVQENCPSQCICTKTVALDLMTVVCDSDTVETLPYVIPEGKYIALSVHSKNLRELSDRVYFRNLTNLDLSSSSISTIHEYFLHNFENLGTIKIYNNSLIMLPEGIQNMNLENLTSLYLHNNPFQCDCHTKWMKYWLQKNIAKIPDLYQVICEAGPAKGKPIIDALDSDFVCDGISLSLVLAISFGGLSALIIFMFAVHYFREPIKVFLIANYRCFQRLRRKVSSNLPFDILIFYSSYDEIYVQEVLIPYLQKDAFGLFTQDNFIPGIPLIDNILDGIDSSFTTLIVLSNKFLQSDWCRNDYQQAYEKVLKENERHPIILILDNELNDEFIPNTLKLYLKTNNCINVSDRRYLSRLLLALPRIQARPGVSERTPLLQDQAITLKYVHAHQ